MKVILDIDKENSLYKHGSEVGLLLRAPDTILNILKLTSNKSLNLNEKIEVVIISGENVDNLKGFVDNLGGEYENLGYGYGIVNITVDKIPELLKSEMIQYLELPKVLYTTDAQSNRAACIQRTQSSFQLEGEGILIGFIDSGIDYTHPAFRLSNGETRIEYIYDLSEDNKVYTKNDINNALKSNNPTSIVSSIDLTEHGTHVAGIACAGGNINQEYYGVAPKSSIAMVKVTRGNFAISTDTMRGLKFLVDKARELKMPLVVNVSLSTNNGAHNGSSLLEQYIRNVADVEKITICIAAGNEGDAAHHVGGDLSQNEDISFNIAGDESQVILNIYKSILPEVSVELISSTAKTTGEIQVKEGYQEGLLGNDRYSIYYTGPKPFDKNGEILISINPNIKEFLDSGIWRLIIRKTNEYIGEYDIWLPISEGLNTKTKFLKPVIENTLGIPATVQNIISVGSYNYVNNIISSYSGRGKEVNIEVLKPDIVAPGEDINSAVPMNSFDSKSGTSMACPHVTGIAALMMEWGIIKKNDEYLYGERLKYYLIQGAKRKRFDLKYPNISWGYGSVCLYDSIQNVINSKRNINRQEPINNNQVGVLIEFDSQSDIDSINKLPNTTTLILSSTYAIVYTNYTQIIDLLEYTKNITFTDVIPIYTLNELSPIEASEAPVFTNNPYLTLNGSGVVVGIIDTGIDYLNKEFIYSNDKTRIMRIWDQNLIGEEFFPGFKFGREYKEEEINLAIKASKEGGDPYSIVASRDVNGHGTKMASIIGARGVNPDVKGVLPDCKFAIVKLREIDNEYLNIANLGKIKSNIPYYQDTSILIALKYLFNLAKDIKMPMVIYIPLGSNIGGHDGYSVLEGVIDQFSNSTGFVVCTCTGNEGDSDTHVEGLFLKPGEFRNLELKIGKKQKDLAFIIYAKQPDKVTISVTSPSGEVMEKIPINKKGAEYRRFVFEGTEMYVQYQIPDNQSGDELITIKARNIKEGIWQFRLNGDYIVDGRYWAWLPQRALLDEETKFLNPTPYTTLTLPATGRNIIVSADYNQNNNAIIGSSGRGYTRDGRIKPDIATGGLNAKVTQIGGAEGIISGSSVGGAVLAGCIGMLLQWAIVEGNDKTIYTKELRSYIISGAQMREGDMYPNREWGYGYLDMTKVFDAIRGVLTGGVKYTTNTNASFERGKGETCYDEYEVTELFIRKPKGM